MKEFLENFLGYHIGWGGPENYSHWYSIWHFVALAVIFSFIISMCVLYRGKTHEQRAKFLRVVGIVMVCLEVGRMIWRTYSHYSYIYKENDPNGISWGEIISFTLCAQLVWFTSITLIINKPKWNRLAYNVLYPPSIIAGLLALFTPTSIFNRYYPFYHFSTLQTAIQHGLILFVPIFLLATGEFKPRFKDFWISVAFAFGFWTIAHISNMIWHRNFLWTENFNQIPFLGDILFPWSILPVAILFPPYSVVLYGIPALLRKLPNKKTAALAATQ